MLYMYVEAPFAACRSFTAGWYRPTATFLTPSAAYGLLLNLAGIESRLREDHPSHNGKVPTTLTHPGLPACSIALGVIDECYPRQQSVYQQLHNYPVGATGKVRAEGTKGNKYNIAPVRREFLSDVKAVIALRGNEDLSDRLRRGLCGEFNDARYGIPFLGDNAFLIDRIQIWESPEVPCKIIHWYEKLDSEDTKARPRATRLTIQIDRADLSKTSSALYAPQISPTSEPPELAWTQLGSTQQ